jgi:hypothetical protein
LTYRSVLPAGHTLIDALLLTAWIWHATIMLKQEKAHLARPPVITTVVLLQEVVPFEPLSVPPSPKFVLLASGTLPAGIVSTYLRPEAGQQWRSRFWDPVWFLIHEAIAIPFWFVLGMLIDIARAHLGRLMWIYLLARCVFGAVDAAFGIAQFFVLLQFLFWLWLAGFGLVQGVRWFMRGMGRATGPASASPKA